MPNIDTHNPALERLHVMPDVEDRLFGCGDGPRRKTTKSTDEDFIVRGKTEQQESPSAGQNILSLAT